MKKLTLITLLISVLFLGDRCQALDMSTPTFFGKHVCVSAGARASRCKVNTGDTLSKDALAVYGDWHRYPAIKDANPNIADPNKIYADAWILIPAVSSGNPIPARATLTNPEKIRRADIPAVTEPETATIAIPTEAIATDTIPLPTFPLPSPATATAAEVATTQVPVEQTPLSDEAPTSAKPEKVVVPRTTGYRFTVGGSGLHGSLETQLVLFNSEDEKRLGLPIQRIDLKPSLAVPADDGDTDVFVRLKKIPAQPFVLLVGGIKTSVDSTQIEAYTGKPPSTHAFARTMASIGRTGAQGAVSFFAGGPAGPLLAACVVGIPQAVKLGVALHEKAQERKLAAKQAAADRSKLALYRASLESETLSKEIRQ